jgi:hypothetical protein
MCSRSSEEGPRFEPRAILVVEEWRAKLPGKKGRWQDESGGGARRLSGPKVAISVVAESGATGIAAIKNFIPRPTVRLPQSRSGPDPVKFRPRKFQSRNTDIRSDLHSRIFPIFFFWLVPHAETFAPNAL